MGNFIPNIAKGAAAEKIRDGANIGLLVLAATGIETDAVLIDKDTIADYLSGTTNEVTNTNYARKTIANASITLTVDDTNDRVDIDIADQTWTSVAAGDDFRDAVAYEDVGGADASRVPLSHHDFEITPNGANVTAQIANLFRAA